MLGLGLFLGHGINGTAGSSLPSLLPGYQFLVDNDGAYLLDDDGSYLVSPPPRITTARKTISFAAFAPTFDFTTPALATDAATFSLGSLPATISVEPLSSYTTTDNFTYKGETVSFGTNIKIGQTLNGQYFIVSDTPGATLTGFTTPSAVVSGLQKHGAEFHPRISTSQGFSQIIGALGGSSAPDASNKTTFTASRNIDPGYTGVPWPIPVGASGRLVKVIENTGYTDPVNGNWQIFDKIIHINIVPSVPPAGAICPIYDDAGNVTWVTTASKNILAGCGYVSGQTTLAAAKAAGWMPDVDQPIYFTVAEQSRPFYANSLITTGYSVDRATYYGRVLNAMHAEGPGGVLDADWYAMVTLGAGMIEREFRGLDNDGAGQFVGEAPFAHMLAMASGDAAIIASFHGMLGNEISQQVWIGDTEIDQAPEYDAFSTGTNHYQRWPFQEVHRNRAHFVHSHNIAGELSLLDSDVACRYEDVSGSGGIIGYNNMVLAQDVHGTGDGLTFLINGSNNTSNPKAAIPAYWARYRTFNAGSSLSGSQPFHTSQDRALYDVAIAQSDVAPLTTTPDAFSPIQNQSTYLTAVTNGFRINMTNAEQATETVTRWDFRYTLDDGISFLDDLNVGTPDYTRTSGIPVGVDIGIENRRGSASGLGPWSVIHPKQDSGGSTTGKLPRFHVTPLGTPTGPPVNVQVPVIKIKAISGYAGPYYDDPPTLTNVPTGTVLYPGVGWWTGDLTGGFTAEWFIDGVSQGGSATYTTQLGDFDITCEITNGGVTVAASNSVNPIAGGSSISIVGYGSYGYTATSAQTYNMSSLVAPGGGGVTLQQNDIIVVTHIASAFSNLAATALTCTGYTAAHTDLYQNDSRDVNMLVQYKRMGVSPDSTITTPANSNAAFSVSGTVMVLRGVDTTTALDVAAVTTTAPNTMKANPPSITPATSGSLITTHAGATTAGAATGDFTEPSDSSGDAGYFTATHRTGTSAGSRAAQQIYDLWAFGAFNPALFDISDSDNTGDSSAAVTLAWRPA